MRETRKQGVKEELPDHIRGLYRYALALTRNGDDAHDLVQDCCTTALDNAHRFECGTNLRAWLFTIMHNRHVSHLRKQSRIGEHVAVNEAFERLIHPSDQIARPELRDLAAALDEMDDDFREVLMLVSVEGFSYQEVAEVLGIPVGTVTSRLSRARSMLRQSMNDNDGRRRTTPSRTTFRVIK